jgi:diamine N-acetyltransferase
MRPGVGGPPTSTQIRTATASDIPVLSTLSKATYVIAFGFSLEPADLHAHLDAHLSEAAWRGYLNADTVLVSEAAGEIIGFVQAGHAAPHLAAFGAGPRDFELRRAYVAPAHQSQGIGRTLIEAAFDLPAMRAAPQVFLDVWDKNHRARALYERLGFKSIGRRPFVSASGRATGADIIMVRRAAANLDL